MTFTGYPDLLACVTHLSHDDVRATMSEDGRHYADAQYGDQRVIVGSVTRALVAPLPSGT